MRTIGVNNIYEYAPWIDALYACDPEWWSVHVKQVRDTNITTLYCQDRLTCERYGLWWTPGVDAAGISTDPAQIHFGMHSGFQALNIAVHLGVKRVLLIGYDCGADSMDHKHFFGNHKLPIFNVDPPYDQWKRHYDTAQAQLIEAGVRVINCTPHSAITAFPKIPLGDALGIR